MFRYCETLAYYQTRVFIRMEDSPVLPLETTEGILTGHEVAEWAGFVSGKLIVKKKDGTRQEFRFGKESQGFIPKIGSLVSIQQRFLSKSFQRSMLEIDHPLQRSMLRIS